MSAQSIDKINRYLISYMRKVEPHPVYQIPDKSLSRHIVDVYTIGKTKDGQIVQTIFPIQLAYDMTYDLDSKLNCYFYLLHNDGSVRVYSDECQIGIKSILDENPRVIEHETRWEKEDDGRFYQPCPICMRSERNILLACGNSFCQDCFAKVYVRKEISELACPICRTPNLQEHARLMILN